MKEFYPRLYIVTDRVAARNRPLELIVEQVIRGGATIVQLREKETSEEEMIATGRRLHAITRKYNVPLVVNDNIRVTLAIDAEGLHIGQGDMSVRQARRRLGSHKILGVSAKSVEEALTAQQDGADYLGVGPIFETRTKKDAGEPIGIKTLSEIVKEVDIPVVAIGGIRTENVASVMRAGASGIAVISAIMGAKDPERATAELLSIVNHYE